MYPDSERVKLLEFPDKVVRCSTGQYSILLALNLFSDDRGKALQHHNFLSSIVEDG